VDLVKTVLLPSGDRIPAFGLGTWRMGEKANARAHDLAAIRQALELGITLLDTAEMYGEGKAEELIGEAIESRREEAFLVSKVYPHNASRQGVATACERSLSRLRTDRIDLYLLHWRGNISLSETLAGFQALRGAGKIRQYGVSNFDLRDMNDLWSIAGGAQIVTNQVLYNLTRRGIEWDLLPWLREHRMPIMAYSPIEQARLVKDGKLSAFAQRNGLTAAQVALAWLLAKDDVIVIPKTTHPERLRENLSAVEVTLTPAQLAELDRLFPPPKGPSSLEML
jgi:diketogulonate reductase-like aldo/keto reductase